MSMTSKYSATPWSIKDWQICDHDGAIEATGSQVVSADGHAISAGTMEGDGPIQEADMHLISAAPDLLEALKHLMPEYHMMPGRLSPSDALAAARAAIAKATKEPA